MLRETPRFWEPASKGYAGGCSVVRSSVRVLILQSFASVLCLEKGGRGWPVKIWEIQMRGWKHAL